MRIFAVIPARYGSTRLPNKPMVLIDGKSMINHVVERVKACREVSRVYVATDHESIAMHVRGFGAEAIMTDPNHRSGTERCAEAIRKTVYAKNFLIPEGILNIQGDEPFIDPAQISQVAREFVNPDSTIVTQARRITDPADLTNPNVVKVVFNAHHQAVYFSRSPIPYHRDIPVAEWLEKGVFYRHVGIYGFRPDILEKVVNLPPTVLEQAESLEQLRWLEAGIPIKVVETQYESVAIDTREDLLKITNNYESYRC